MWPFLDERCLDTARALLLDGANGVCGDARLGAGTGSWIHLVALVGAAIAVAGWLVRASGRARTGVVIAALLIAAMPGIHAVLTRRADRPFARAATGRQSEALHDRLRAFALAHRCAEVVADECEECFPAARLALTDLRCPLPAPVELRRDAFEAHCEAREATLVCGHPR